MTKNAQLIEKIVVTFFEAGISYLAINQTNLSGNVKLTAIGALGAGLSATYNVLRQSEPTIVSEVQQQFNNPPVSTTLVSTSSTPLPTDLKPPV